MIDSIRQRSSRFARSNCVSCFRKWRERRRRRKEEEEEEEEDDDDVDDEVEETYPDSRSSPLSLCDRYRDHAPPAPRRHLLRLWLATPEGPDPLHQGWTSGWKTIYSDSTHERRGGIQGGFAGRERGLKGDREERYGRGCQLLAGRSTQI
jgi:hypothetical protein